MSNKSSFEDDDDSFTHTGSNSTNSTREGDAKTTKKVNFGVFELSIFVCVWIVMLVAYKMWSRRAAGRKQGWFKEENMDKRAYEEAVAAGEEDEDKLKRLLMRRCITNVKRLMDLQENRDSVHSLSKTGLLPEELLVTFKAAEKDMELEIYEVQAEAETFKEGWGAEIIQDAARLCRIEEELTAAKQRQEQTEKAKDRARAMGTNDKPKGTGEKASPSSLALKKDEPVRELDEKEKQKLLQELLEDDSNDAAAVRAGSTGGGVGSKAKKRLSIGKK